MMSIVENTVSLSMALLLAVATPIGGDGQAWAQWGLAGLLVGYTQWRDWKREDEMRGAREADHKWIREQMVPAIQNNTAVLNEANGHLKRLKGAA